ncbi:MAG: ribonucleotide-diphosphate reductase subunit beta [Ghiorsea sp.]
MSEMKILDTNNLIQSNNDKKIFLGNYGGFQRFDQYKYVFAKSIESKMRNAFWNPEEISLVTDRLKFADLPEHAKDIVTTNLLFQTLMDSAQSRGLDSVLIGMTTSPEWEMVFKTQAYFESIHSLSYSHIIREVFPDATKEFDKIQDIPEITHRIDDEVNCYNKFNTSKFKNADEESRKKMILELLVRIYALEGVKFYVSFLVTYTINNSYNNAIQGISRIIKLINFDEDIHVSVFAGLIGILKKNTDEGFHNLIKSDWFEEMTHKVFRKVVKDEISWGAFLLSKGNVPTLTNNIIEAFVKFFANKRLNQIKVPELYVNAKSNDVIEWFESYRNIDLDNTAGQEAEGLAYNRFILKDDMPAGKFSFDK